MKGNQARRRWLGGCFMLLSFAAVLAVLHAGPARADATVDDTGVAVLLIDTDRVIGTVDERIYGQFLEHINHSVEGLFAEQVQGRGFEGRDFETYRSEEHTSELQSR